MDAPVLDVADDERFRRQAQIRLELPRPPPSPLGGCAPRATGQTVFLSGNDFGDTVLAGAAGFGTKDKIDLPSVHFVRGRTKATFTEASNHQSGTLTIANGSQPVSVVLLGQYAAGNFTVTNDGHGGTLITERTRTHAHFETLVPPVTSSG